MNLVTNMYQTLDFSRNQSSAQAIAHVAYNDYLLKDFDSTISAAKKDVDSTLKIGQEIIVDPTINNPDGSKIKNGRIVVYNTVSNVPYITLPFSKTLPASGSTTSSVPRGVIAAWYGSAATIPSGWQLCDGTNGTPDLRSRFIYGAGGDTNTKVSYGTGWNAVNGHWNIGQVGGEEQHTLTIAEMPSHAHKVIPEDLKPVGYIGGGGSGRGWHTAGYPGDTGAAGGNAPHNILPRFMTLAYIMKL